MGLKEGSIVLINLHCGCCERRVTLIDGLQEIKCPECGKETYVEISVNSKGDVERLNVC